MNKCKLIIQIHSGLSAAQTGDVWVEKSFTLPFVPSDGHTINFGDDYSFTIETKPQRGRGHEISYDIKTKLVQIWGEENEIYDGKVHGTEHRPINEIVKEYKSWGFKVRNN
jgi:hypothetical protein